MSTNKQNFYQRQEQQDEIRRGADAMSDPNKCSICMAPKSPQSKSNKCDKCLTTMENIPSGFPFIAVNGEESKEFECPICLCIIKGATELSCEHLMCGDCLIHYENEQRTKAKRLVLFVV